MLMSRRTALRHYTSVTALTLALCAAGIAPISAQEVSLDDMVDLGTLQTGTQNERSGAFAVSADGSTIVGSARTDDTNSFGNTVSRAFRWIDDGNGMTDLGTLQTGTQDGGSFAFDVSADGSTIVGNAQTDDTNSFGSSPFRAFRWIDDGNGMTDLGTLQTGTQDGRSDALVVSADGSTIVGFSQTDDRGERAFRWIDDGNGMTDLGTLQAGTQDGSSFARAVNADGSTIVGFAQTDDTNSFGTAVFPMSRAFRWIDDNNGMTDLGTLQTGTQDGSSDAFAVSADGSTIVGSAQTDDTEGSGNFVFPMSRAFRWIDDNNGMTDLGTLQTGTQDGRSNAFAVSADGSTIVGDAQTDDTDSFDNPLSRAFRWIDDGNGMTDLGTLQTGTQNGNSLAIAVSADGSTIVGSAQTDDTNSSGNPLSRAFRWTDPDVVTVSGGTGGGMEDLGTLRADNSGSSGALAVSADGSTIVGVAATDDTDSFGNPVSRAFIFRSVMQDTEALILSVPELANDTAIVVARQSQTARILRDTHCSAAEGVTCGRITGSLLTNTDTTSQGYNIGSNTDLLGTATLGYGISPNVTLGGTLMVNTYSFDNNAFDPDTTFGLGAFAVYSETGDYRTGLNLRGGISWQSGETDITRGFDEMNVQDGTGSADLETLSLSLQASYGAQVSETLLLTPYAGLAWEQTTRSAYAEPGTLDTPASYDALQVNRTVLTLGADAEITLDSRSVLRFGAGLETDLNRDAVVLTGTSTIPGLANFSAASSLDHNSTRGFVNVGYAIETAPGRSWDFNTRVGQAEYGDGASMDVTIGYNFTF